MINTAKFQSELSVTRYYMSVNRPVLARIPHRQRTSEGQRSSQELCSQLSVFCRSLSRTLCRAFTGKIPARLTEPKILFTKPSINKSDGDLMIVIL